MMYSLGRQFENMLCDHTEADIQIWSDLLEQGIIKVVIIVLL